MTDSQEEVEGAMTPLQMYERLNAQGEQVRCLKTAKAEKVSDLISVCMTLS